MERDIAARLLDNAFPNGSYGIDVRIFRHVVCLTVDEANTLIVAIKRAIDCMGGADGGEEEVLRDDYRC